MAAGGILSGEHGIGLEKRDYMGLMFSDDDLAAQAWLRDAFDPDGVCNPWKVLPEAARAAATSRTFPPAPGSESGADRNSGPRVERLRRSGRAVTTRCARSAAEPSGAWAACRPRDAGGGGPAGVVAHEPAEMIVRVRAGTTARRAVVGARRSRPDGAARRR